RPAAGRAAGDRRRRAARTLRVRARRARTGRRRAPRNRNARRSHRRGAPRQRGLWLRPDLRPGRRGANRRRARERLEAHALPPRPGGGFACRVGRLLVIALRTADNRTALGRRSREARGRGGSALLFSLIAGERRSNELRDDAEAFCSAVRAGGVPRAPVRTWF